MHGIAGSGDTAVGMLDETTPDLILLDINLGREESAGIDAARRIIANYSIPVIFLAAYDDPVIAGQAAKVPNYGYLRTPIDAGDLRIAIEIALHRHRDEVRIHSERLETEQYRTRELERQVQALAKELTEARKHFKKEIDERNAIDKRQGTSSREKDLLLREIHHRVKNNLQLVSGLLDMTRMRTQDPELINALTDVMLKIQTMAQIHTRLYESKRFDRIAMNRQIHEQMTALSRIYYRKDREVTNELHCSGIYLPVDQALPCALVLNEILSNSYKHAFRGRTQGSVIVSVRKRKDRLRISIRDDGIGIPRGFDINLANRLGLKLVRTLVQQQLKGSFTVKSDKGTEVIVEFPMLIPGKEHVNDTYC